MSSRSDTRQPRLDSTDRRILRLAFPALGALAVEPLYVLVDTAIIGRVGTDELAGLAVAAAVLALVFAGSNFLTYGTTQRVAHHVGAGDRAGAAGVGVQALWLSLFVGLPAAPLLAFGAPGIVSVFGASGAVADHAVEYLQIRAVAVPFMLVTLAAQGVLRGVSDYRSPLVVLAVTNAGNVVLELVLVFGVGLGIAGAAWSTVAAQITAALAFAVLVRHRVALTPSWRPQWSGQAPLLLAGRHLLLRVGAMLGVLSGTTAIAARTDAPTLAAHQVVMSMFLLVALTLDALAVPAQTIVAEELGRGGRAAARVVADRVVRLSIMAGAALTLLLALGAPVLPSVFSPDPAVASRATAGLLILAVSMVPAAVAFAHDGVLIGAGDYRFLGVAAVGYLVAVAPLGALTLAVEGLGIAGLWTTLAAWMLLRAVVNDRRTRHLLPHHPTELSA
jgi:putative MATE family efflux protein